MGGEEGSSSALKRFALSIEMLGFSATSAPDLIPGSTFLSSGWVLFRLATSSIRPLYFLGPNTSLKNRTGVIGPGGNTIASSTAVSTSRRMTGATAPTVASTFHASSLAAWAIPSVAAGNANACYLVSACTLPRTFVFEVITRERLIQGEGTDEAVLSP